MHKTNDWVIPMGTKKIVQIEAIEEYDDVVVAYTSDRSAYPINNLEDIRTVYQREFKTEK